MARMRSPIVLIQMVFLLSLTRAAPYGFAAPPPAPACPPGSAPAYPGSGDCILDATTIPQYVIPLVIPPVMRNTGTDDDYDIAVRQFRQQILPGGIWNGLNGRNDALPATTIWSYGPTADPLPDSTDLGGGVGIAPAANSQFNYPAYTIETTAAGAYGPGSPVSVIWRNELMENFGAGPRFLPHILPIDQTLHWANPPMLCIDGTRRTDCRGFSPSRYMGPVPIVTHVHGAHVEGDSDGYPEAWWLPAAMNVPAGYATHGTTFDDADGDNPGNLGYAHYVYRNDQPAATIWYHDHALGMTRNNVYAGPAGFWLIRGGENDQVDDFSDSTLDWDGTLPYPAPAYGEGVVEVNVTNRGKYREIPIAIQARSFKADGSLFYPATRAFFEGIPNNRLTISFIPSAQSDLSPIWNPEAFFDVMVVNGVAWPKLEVAQALYRFRFLNGCNSRFLWLKFDNEHLDVWQIGAEQGFVGGRPVNLRILNLDGSGDRKAQILMALAERADVIVDFRGIPNGTEIQLLNIGPDEPFGGGIPGVDFDPADPSTTGKVMKFMVNSSLNGESDSDPGGNGPDATDPRDLRMNAERRLTGPSETRQVSLNEAVSKKVCAQITEDGEGNIVRIRQIHSVRPGPDFEADCEGAGGQPFGPKEALLGILSDGSPVPLMWTDRSAGSAVPVQLTNGNTVKVWVTENPKVGDQETWEIFNFTADAHPIHLHLVRFIVINRQGLLLDGEEVSLPATLDGTSRGPEPWESGYKDTVIAYPGEVTRVKALFDIEGLYVWHCHIVEHEDNEMMRPFIVSGAAAAAPAVAPQEDFGFGGL